MIRLSNTPKLAVAPPREERGSCHVSRLPCIVLAMKKRTLIIGAAVALVAAAVAFTPGDPEPEPVAASPASTKPAAASKAPEPEPSPASRCLPVKKAFAEQILDGGNETELGYVDAAAVKEDGNYFVAIRFEVEGVPEPQVGVWQTLNLKTGPIRSVDGFALEFTVWPDSGNIGADVVGEAKACLG